MYGFWGIGTIRTVNHRHAFCNSTSFLSRSPGSRSKCFLNGPGSGRALVLPPLAMPDHNVKLNKISSQKVIIILLISTDNITGIAFDICRVFTACKKGTVLCA